MGNREGTRRCIRRCIGCITGVISETAACVSRRADAGPKVRRTMPELAGKTVLVSWLHLANLQLSARLTGALLAHFRHDPQAVFSASDSELEDVPGIQGRHLVRIRDPGCAPTERQIAWMERQQVRLLAIGDSDYPRVLQEIQDPPALLFLQGALHDTDRVGVGIVGSRHATPYGRATAERLAQELAGQGLTVISGGAVGIDSAAHRGALAAGGRTVAVLGCGLDVDYPRENRTLFERIALSGALISEYPPGAQPEAWRFPLRNRIISGLAQGILVIEAPRQSGALITARFAAEHGRTVMTVPGNIDRPASQGSNDLLKDGAVPVTENADVLRALHMLALPARPEHQSVIPLEWDTDPGATLGADAPAVSRPASADLTAGQKRLLACLSLTPRHIDAVAQEAGVSIVQAGVEMTLLELGGLAHRLPGNAYIRAL